eukprot:TRINITY_DN9667_c0_g1_i1.p1 TRINITY_DN9667_c0_g1~~TRINITY_DN9667_c0_g1_i1.p1  ORF type:complete len:117 (-),score=0.38 TRINITY_DN9667_c0_g1_i1:792-1142(-)
MSNLIEFISAEALLRAISAQLVRDYGAGAAYLVASLSIEKRADLYTARNWDVVCDLLNTPAEAAAAIEVAADIVATRYQLERRRVPRTWKVSRRHSVQYAPRSRANHKGEQSLSLT